MKKEDVESVLGKEVLVTLNGKPMLGVVDADDEEGWVEIINPKKTSEDVFKEEKNLSIKQLLKQDTITEEKDLPTKKLYGKVVFFTSKK